MKAKQIIPLVILTLIVLSIISASIIFFNTREKKDLKRDSVDIEVSENINSENVEKSDKEKETECDKIEEQKDNNMTTDDSSKTESITEVIKESNDVTTNTSKNDTSVSTDNNNINDLPDNYNETSSNNSQVVEQPKQSTPWDSLGITEYEYYNSPAHSWAEVNFSVKDYGTQESALKACQDYGNSYIDEHSGGYWCISINSYSGDYLGEDFDYYN